MSRNNHPIENEELMAYLDGELATDRAVEAAAHLEHCQECQELAADLRQLSQEMMAWEVEELGSIDIPRKFTVVLEKKKSPKNQAINPHAWRTLFTMRRLVWGVGSALAILFISVFSVSRLRPMYQMKSFSGPKQADAVTAQLLPPPPPSATPAPMDDYYSPYSASNKLRIAPGIVAGEVADGFVSAQNSDSNLNVGDEVSKAPTVPMIARVAGLTLTTKEFDKTRGSLDEILKRYGGYLGQLQVSAPADTGRTLTATLRIPAPQLDAAMAELKKLGRVEGESQGGEEVTQQYVDLEARLANSKHTEQRLTEILTQRTGKLQDVLKVELEIDRVRGEIEQMQAEKKELSKRVAFATLSTTIQEEYQARLQATPPSTGSRFRNAAVDGYNTVVEGLISIGLFLLSAGPSLLLWAAILFFPARWAWRRFKAYSKQKHGEEEKAE
ncbi:MAG TPA: DUF4349 domain-containing protein [Candidatus Angelobacter sp.]|nr:DUF4349 domain-containing protein [Candidatus Angelobacter sp.]